LARCSPACSPPKTSTDVQFTGAQERWRWPASGGNPNPWSSRVLLPWEYCALPSSVGNLAGARHSKRFQTCLANNRESRVCDGRQNGSTGHRTRQNVPIPSHESLFTVFPCTAYETLVWTSTCRFNSRPGNGGYMQIRPRAVAFLSVLLLGSVVWGNDHKLSPDLKGRHSAGAVDVIVQFKVAPAQKHRDRIAAHGGLVKQHLSTVKALLVSLPASRLQSLSNDPDIAYVSPDRRISKQMNNA